jgi:hypothetical protein
MLNLNCIGTELSEEQVKYSITRLEDYREKNDVI